MQVYKAIAAVTAEIAKEGISKDRKNEQQNYKFRGIDDVYNALSPVLAKHGLVILPRVLNRECVERVTSKGGAIFYVTVEVEFDFIAAEDGSRHTVKTFGEAMDLADKATNKAMSAAYKYAAMQAFCIPTEGDNDADAITHEVAPRQVAAKGPDWKQEGRDIAQIVNGITEVDALTDFYKTPRVQAYLKNSPNGDALKATFSERKHVLTRQAEAA
jgi:hypothetical protein